MKIGELLKEARKEKGLTLAQVAGETFIQEKYLQALEDSNYELIPGEAYQRAFFRTYADYLGLGDYIESLTRPHRFAPEEEEPPVDDIFGGTWDNTRLARVALKLGSLIVILVMIVMGLRALQKPPDQPEESERVTGTQTLDVVPSDSARSWDFPDDDASTGTPGRLADMAHEIKLTTLGRCWVELRTREGAVFPPRDLVAGEVLSYRDLFGFYLKAGAPEKLEVVFDGEPIEWQPGQMEMLLPPGAAILHDDENPAPVDDDDSE